MLVAQREGAGIVAAVRREHLPRARMRRLEWFHPLRCPDGAWAVLRLDGRGFARCEKPFDERFHAWMVWSSKCTTFATPATVATKSNGPCAATAVRTASW